MAAYILHRMVWTVVVMAMVGIFVFLLLRLAAGDPAAILAGDSATPQMIEGIREKLGFNDPLPVQFVHWALGILRGDFGTSIFTGRPVLELISQRLEPTISLTILTMIVSVTVGSRSASSPLGEVAALLIAFFLPLRRSGFRFLCLSLAIFSFTCSRSNRSGCRFKDTNLLARAWGHGSCD